MTFQEIFNNDGLYRAAGFANGVAFKIKDGVMTIVEYKSPDDLQPREENFPVYKELFSKKFTKVLTINTLF